MSPQAGTPAPSEIASHTSNVEAPRLALRRSEAAAALGVSDEAFDRYVRPTLPVVRCGTLRLYPVAGLADWLADRASTPVGELELAA